GKVEHDRMPELLDEADVYLNANHIDNMPASLIECMAAGAAIVTTDAGGIPYIVANEQTALIVPRNEHVAMAGAAIRLFQEDGLARGLVTRARAECEKYQWESVRADWISLYRELCDREVGVAHREKNDFKFQISNSKERRDSLRSLGD